jgi:hypothetical protein
VVTSAETTRESGVTRSAVRAGGQSRYRERSAASRRQIEQKDLVPGGQIGANDSSTRAHDTTVSGRKDWLQSKEAFRV